MNKPQITKAKMDKDGKIKAVTYSVVQEDGSVLNHPATSGSAVAHADLIAAFAQLDHHLASLSEQYTGKGKLDTELSCRSFSLNGDDEKETVILSGVRYLSKNKALILNSPRLLWNHDTAEEVYPDSDSLKDDIGVCKNEVYKYLFEGKHAPEPVQLEIKEHSELIKPVEAE